MKRVVSFYLVLLSIIFGSCLGMQPDDTKDDEKTVLKNKLQLIKIFSENEEFCENRAIGKTPTPQNINDLLWWAVVEAQFELVQQIIKAIPHIIEEYTQLYAAVRAGEEGIEKLQALLEKGVNPNGYGSHCCDDPTALAWIKQKCEFNKENQHSDLKVHKQIYQLLEKNKAEESSPLAVARALDNHAAVKLVLESGAYEQDKLDDSTSPESSCPKRRIRTSPRQPLSDITDEPFL